MSPLAEQAVFAMQVKSGECYAEGDQESKWVNLPSMEGQGSLHATLLVMQNRYIYQISGCFATDRLICRLDFDNPIKGWKNYEMPLLFTKVPRQMLDFKGKEKFDYNGNCFYDIGLNQSK